MSQKQGRYVSYDGLKILGDGEEVIDENDGNGCMSARQFYGLSHRGHQNNFIGLYIEDPNCGDDELGTMKPFVRCVGGGAIIPDDGASCTCGDNSRWNADINECECVEGHMASTWVNWRRNSVCTLCSGVGAYNNYYGDCKCGANAVLNDNSECVCEEGLVPDPDNKFCFDGIEIGRAHV